MKPAIEMDEDHRYYIGDEVLPSVTTILDATVPIPFKAGSNYGQKIACQGIAALFRTGYVGKGMTGDDLVKALKASGLSVDDAGDRASDHGTRLHTALEVYCTEQKMPQTADYPEEDHPRIKGLIRWLIENQPVAEAVEVRTYSATYGYAGTFDLRCTFNAGDYEGARALVDLKNVKKIYDKNYIQLEAYEQAEQEWGVQPTDFRALLHLTPTGRPKLKISTFEFEDFYVLLQAYKRMEARKAAA